MRRAPDEISNDTKCMAWRIPKQLGNPNKAAEASLAAWLVHQPKVHPLWEYWVVNVAHLRDVEGCKPANLHFDGASHEFSILSVNPEECPSPDPDKPAELRILSPPDLIKQLKDIDDAQAKTICSKMIAAVISGRMALDSDYSGAWITLLDNTVAHLCTGCPPGVPNN